MICSDHLRFCYTRPSKEDRLPDGVLRHRWDHFRPLLTDCKVGFFFLPLFLTAIHVKLSPIHQFYVSTWKRKEKNNLTIELFDYLQYFCSFFNENDVVICFFFFCRVDVAVATQHAGEGRNDGIVFGAEQRCTVRRHRCRQFQRTAQQRQFQRNNFESAEWRRFCMAQTRCKYLII